MRSSLLEILSYMTPLGVRSEFAHDRIYMESSFSNRVRSLFFEIEILMQMESLRSPLTCPGVRTRVFDFQPRQNGLGKPLPIPNRVKSTRPLFLSRVGSETYSVSSRACERALDMEHRYFLVVRNIKAHLDTDFQLTLSKGMCCQRKTRLSRNRKNGLDSIGK